MSLNPARAVPPVHSPLPLRALLAGALAAVAPRPFDARVEELVRAGYGPRGFLPTDSGTGALRLALEGLRSIRPGAVALPAYSCFDVATAAVGAGVEVLLYDLDPRTLSPDAESLRRTLEAGAVAAVVVHLYGVPVEMDAVRAVVRGRDAVLVEDAAQAAGGLYGGRPLGTLGSLAVLSFGRGKGITAGRGGMLLANDALGREALAAVAERADGRRAGVAPLAAAGAQWLLGRSSLYGLPRAVPWLGLGETRYREPERPRALPRSAAGVLSVTLGTVKEASRARATRAARLLERVQASGEFDAVRPPAAGTAGWLRLPVLASEAEAAAARSRAVRRLGVMPGYPTTLDRLPPLRPALRAPAGRHPGATALADRLLTLPTHDRLRETDLRRLERWLTAR